MLVTPRLAFPTQLIEIKFIAKVTGASTPVDRMLAEAEL
jgi:hypothetical protein